MLNIPVGSCGLSETRRLITRGLTEYAPARLGTAQHSTKGAPMSEDETFYERRLNALLYDAANKTDEFARQKIAIIEAGNALQDSYIAALQQCCRKHDEVLKLEEYVLTRFQRALPTLQARDEHARISTAQDALESVSEQFVDPTFAFLRRIA
jgi:hypothetical protein